MISLPVTEVPPVAVTTLGGIGQQPDGGKQRFKGYKVGGRGQKEAPALFSWHLSTNAKKAKEK